MCDVLKPVDPAGIGYWNPIGLQIAHLYEISPQK